MVGLNRPVRLWTVCSTKATLSLRPCASCGFFGEGTGYLDVGTAQLRIGATSLAVRAHFARDLDYRTLATPAI